MVKKMVTDKRKEKLSAFLDNDMHRDELMSFSLSSEADDAKIVQRYQILGDALRGEISDSSFVDVSAAVRDAISDVTLAGVTSADATLSDVTLADKKTSASTKQPVSKSGFFDISGWFRPVAGMAMAVSVAVLVVFTVTEQNDASITPVASNVDDFPAAVQLASDSKDSEEFNSEADSIAASSGLETLADPRLVNQHLEFATQDSLQGRMPYVRAVSFESNDRFESGRFEPESASSASSASGNIDATGK